MTTLVRTSCAIASALLALALGACDRQTPPAAKKAEVPVANLPAEPPPPVAAPEKAAEPPEVAADKELAGKVKSALLAERSLNAHGIDVVAKNGTVTLFGTAETVVRRDTAG